MKHLRNSAAVICLIAGSLIGASAQAAPHRDNWHDKSDWRKGGYVAHDEWNHGHQVDYRSHHLRKPPRGYEWREVNGNYVLAAVATGVIASLILNHH